MVRSLLGGFESEVARRMVHVSGSLVPLSHLAAPDVVTWQVVQAIVAVGLIGALALEVIRLGLGLDWWIYDHLTREYEQDNLAGYALAVISAAVVVFAVPPTIAIPSILMLTLGDPISGLLGADDSQFVGRPGTFEVIRKPPSVLGIMFVVCTVIALPFVYDTNPLVAVFGGAAAMLADGLKPVIFTYVIDDNLSIPLAAAAALSLGLAVV
jgi:dolichol kinase